MDDVKISWWFRLLAVLFLVAAVVVFVSVAIQALDQGLAIALQPIGGFLGTVAVCYLSFLFGYVAILGRAPNKFFPLASLRWPFRANGA